MKKFVYILMVLLLLSACSNDETEENKGASEEGGLFPLTGMETDEGVNNRIVGVMVNNHPKARPQTGLSKADIVFEMLTEGDITRLLALYQSEQPEVVGPVRSAREYYFNLAKDYDAIYVYHGAAGFVDDMIEDSGVEFLNGKDYDNDGHLFKRESFRKAPHNSYLQFDAVFDVASENGYHITAAYEPMQFLGTEELAEIPGEAAHQVEVKYSSNPAEAITYVYDEDEAVYNRFTGGEQTVELESNKPVQLENVFIIETSHQVIDDEGRRKIDLEFGGNAYLLQQGKIQQIEWENQNGRIVPVNDGNPVGLVPGKTWINVMPKNPGIESSVTVLE